MIVFRRKERRKTIGSAAKTILKTAISHFATCYNQYQRSSQFYKTFCYHRSLFLLLILPSKARSMHLMIKSPNNSPAKRAGRAQGPNFFSKPLFLFIVIGLVNTFFYAHRRIWHKSFLIYIAKIYGFEKKSMKFNVHFTFFLNATIVLELYPCLNKTDKRLFINKIKKFNSK